MRGSRSTSAKSRFLRLAGLILWSLQVITGLSAAERVVRVGLYVNEPKIFVDAAGEAAGIFPAILEEVARREGWSLVWMRYTWAEGLSALERGEIDLMPDVAYSKERAQRFDFHAEEVLTSWSSVYATPGIDIDSLADLGQRSVAVLKGSVQHRDLQSLASGFGLEIRFEERDSFAEAFRAVGSRQVDAVACNQFYGDHRFRDHGLVKTPIVFGAASLFFATGKGRNGDLLAAIDQRLRHIKDEPGSAYYRELGRWMERPPRVVMSSFWRWTIVGISTVLLLVLVLAVILHWQVRLRTRHLDRANRVLAESEEKFRRLFDDHTAPMLLIDRRKGAVVQANAAAASFYGRTIEDLARMTLAELGAEPTAAGDPGRSGIGARHRMVDGSFRDVELYTSRISAGGVDLDHLIIHDVTERRQLEVQVQQMQRIDSLGRLAGGVAHDFNNMLLVIIGYSELALADLAGDHPIRSRLIEVLKAANRSRDIVRQLLAFARKDMISPKVFNLDESIGATIGILRKLIGDQIDLRWTPGVRDAAVVMDPSHLDQILTNLCVNARDAIGGDGGIRIRTEEVVFDDQYCAIHVDARPGTFLMISVSDNGCGMDQATIDRIYEPFFTTKEAGKGTGLGLSTVHGIVKQSNGFINVYSEPGQGTVFRIYLPRSERKPSGSVPMADLPRAAGESVLVVENEPAIRNLTATMLRDLGYQVHAAQDPMTALALAAPPLAVDLLLTDVIMPGMNGRILAQRLGERYSSLRCLFMSGYTAEVLADRSDIPEGDVFLQKPFPLRELARRVRTALDGADPRDP